MKNRKNIYYQLRESTETDNAPALTQPELAKAFLDEGNPVAQSIISKIETSKKNPPSTAYNVLKAYSQYFNVTTDYLLGIRETSTVDEDIAMINRVTGLSEKSIETLKSLHNGNMPNLIDTLNYIIETDFQLFTSFIDAIELFFDGEYNTPMQFDGNVFVPCNDIDNKDKPILKTNGNGVVIGKYDCSLCRGEGGYHTKRIPISILKESYSFTTIQETLRTWKKLKGSDQNETT